MKKHTIELTQLEVDLILQLTAKVGGCSFKSFRGASSSVREKIIDLGTHDACIGPMYDSCIGGIAFSHSVIAEEEIGRASCRERV